MGIITRGYANLITATGPNAVADGSIVNDDISASASIASTKLSGVNDAKAWVNFDGTGTPAIRASFNVTSITDNGTGDHTVNFTTALTDANYAVAGSALNANDTYKRVLTLKDVSGTYLTTTSVRVQTGHSAVGALENEDCLVVTVIIFR